MTVPASRADPQSDCGYNPTPASLVRLAWRLAGRDGEPHGPLAKKITRAVRVIARGREDPHCARRARGRRRHNRARTNSKHDDALALITAALHLARLRRESPGEFARICEGPSGLQRFAPGTALWRRYARARRPWRGAAGRAAAAAYGRSELEALRKVACELHAAGLSDAAIAQRLGCSAKTVSRYLHGHRVRRRTGAPRRGARGRFAPDDRGGHPKLTKLAAPAALESSIDNYR